MARPLSLLERFYPESRFGGFSDLDGTVAFYGRIQALLAVGMTVLDVGCGRGAGLVEDPVAYRRKLRSLRGDGRRVIGLDVDPDADQNPGLDEFHRIDGVSAWPIPDASIDLIVSDFVLEHINDPEAFFAEVARVLRPGGVFCARTPNRIGYVGLAASLIPNRRHAQMLRMVQEDRKEMDVFPTYYRVNTIWAVHQVLKQAGMEGIVYGYEAEPSYLQFSALAYALGKYLHIFTPSVLRTCLFVFARKPGNGSMLASMESESGLHS